MTIYAIFYVLAAVLYLACGSLWYLQSFQAETPENTFWIRPVIVGGLMIQAFSHFTKLCLLTVLLISAWLFSAFYHSLYMHADPTLLRPCSQRFQRC